MKHQDRAGALRHGRQPALGARRRDQPEPGREHRVAKTLIHAAVLASDPRCCFSSDLTKLCYRSRPGSSWARRAPAESRPMTALADLTAAAGATPLPTPAAASSFATPHVFDDLAGVE